MITSYEYYAIRMSRGEAVLNGEVRDNDGTVKLVCYDDLKEQTTNHYTLEDKAKWTEQEALFGALHLMDYTYMTESVILRKRDIKESFAD
jgi:hypothetical protein